MRVRCKNKGPKGVSHARNATRGQLRKAMTHVAVICNDTTLQPSQILLLAKKSAPLKQLAGWQAMKGCSAELVRRLEDLDCWHQHMQELVLEDHVLNV